MVAIAPFRALRYNLDIVGSLDCVVAPPYDVISPEEQDRLYARSPYNIVRLTYGKQFETDGASNNRYTRARETLTAWRKEGVLVRDAAPALYVTEQVFRWQGVSLRRVGAVPTGRHWPARTSPRRVGSVLR